MPRVKNRKNMSSFHRQSSTKGCSKWTSVEQRNGTRNVERNVNGMLYPLFLFLFWQTPRRWGLYWLRSQIRQSPFLFFFFIFVVLCTVFLCRILPPPPPPCHPIFSHSCSYPSSTDYQCRHCVHFIPVYCRTTQWFHKNTYEGADRATTNTYRMIDIQCYTRVISNFKWEIPL